MSWTEVFAVLIVSHLAGDYLLQTEWQAANKHGGLGPDPVGRRALLGHIATYGLAFVPALVWLASDIGWWAVLAALGIVLPHLIQDDGRPVLAYLRFVKRTSAGPQDFIFIAVDQSLHVLALFVTALAVAA
jgi:Protein of unknown function (DUF3307)